MKKTFEWCVDQKRWFETPYGLKKDEYPAGKDGFIFLYRMEPTSIYDPVIEVWELEVGSSYSKYIKEYKNSVYRTNTLCLHNNIGELVERLLEEADELPDTLSFIKLMQEIGKGTKNDLETASNAAKYCIKLIHLLAQQNDVSIPTLLEIAQKRN